MQDSIDSTAQDVSPASPPAEATTTELAADAQPPGDDGEQGTPQEVDGAEQEAAAAPVHPPSPAPASQTSQQDRYDYDSTSILLVAHFRPVSQDGQSRQVWLSAQNGVGNEQDFPLYRVLSETDLGGPWPPVVARLLEDLRQDLPVRRQRYETRQTTKPTVTAAPSSQTRHQTQVAAASTRHGKAPAAPTPVPPSATSIPKEELGMAGLFEGME
jgi:hypothetical protein